MQDADECIKLKPDFAKGYSRKGHLQFFMKEYDKAMATYEQGLRNDPSNEELKDGVRRCIEAISKVGVRRRRCASLALNKRTCMMRKHDFTEQLAVHELHCFGTAVDQAHAKRCVF
jgi:tetratricopeptide (TPR) repeat protein